MIKPFNLNKIKSYKGSVLKDLKAPDNYKTYSATCRKIIKIYTRCHEDEIFYPELIDAVKEVASALRFLGLSTFKHKAPDNLIEYLEEISLINITRWLEMKHNLILDPDAQVLVEETRERTEGTHCSFCRVRLHFPSYVVTRSEEKVIHRSHSIGVKCLRSQHGKLKKFLDAPQVVLALQEMKQILVATTA